MALDRTPTPITALRRSTGRTGRIAGYLPGVLVVEGIALAQEVLSSAERIQTAAATGSRSQVINEAGRLGVRATAAIAEFRRLAKSGDYDDAA